MAGLLRELDHGPAALPRGSEVVLFHQHDPPHLMPEVSVLRNKSRGISGAVAQCMSAGATFVAIAAPAAAHATGRAALRCCGSSRCPHLTFPHVGSSC